MQDSRGVLRRAAMCPISGNSSVARHLATCRTAVEAFNISDLEDTNAWRRLRSRRSGCESASGQVRAMAGPLQVRACMQHSVPSIYTVGGQIYPRPVCQHLRIRVRLHQLQDLHTRAWSPSIAGAIEAATRLFHRFAAWMNLSDRPIGPGQPTPPLIRCASSLGTTRS